MGNGDLPGWGVDLDAHIRRDESVHRNGTGIDAQIGLENFGVVAGDELPGDDHAGHVTELCAAGGGGVGVARDKVQFDARAGHGGDHVAQVDGVSRAQRHHQAVADDLHRPDDFGYFGDDVFWAGRGGGGIARIGGGVAHGVGLSLGQFLALPFNLRQGLTPRQQSLLRQVAQGQLCHEFEEALDAHHLAIGQHAQQVLSLANQLFTGLQAVLNECRPIMNA